MTTTNFYNSDNNYEIVNAAQKQLDLLDKRYRHLKEIVSTGNKMLNLIAVWDTVDTSGSDYCDHPKCLDLPLYDDTLCTRHRSLRDRQDARY